LSPETPDQTGFERSSFGIQLCLLFGQPPYFRIRQAGLFQHLILALKQHPSLVGDPEAHLHEPPDLRRQGQKLIVAECHFAPKIRKVKVDNELLKLTGLILREWGLFDRRLAWRVFLSLGPRVGRQSQ
jgi:hypothetical protein